VERETSSASRIDAYRFVTRVGKSQTTSLRVLPIEWMLGSARTDRCENMGLESVHYISSLETTAKAGGLLISTGKTHGALHQEMTPAGLRAKGETIGQGKPSHGFLLMPASAE
jgi:hypothetical protein